MAAKRASMKGMGADAFFAPPPESPQTGEPVSQQDAMPTYQDDGKAISQQGGKAALQHGSEPAAQYEKATFYLGRRHIMRLEQLRLERMQRGEKVDKSALVREAIENLPQ